MCCGGRCSIFGKWWVFLQPQLPRGLISRQQHSSNFVPQVPLSPGFFLQTADRGQRWCRPARTLSPRMSRGRRREVKLRSSGMARVWLVELRILDMPWVQTLRVGSSGRALPSTSCRPRRTVLHQQRQHRSCLRPPLPPDLMPNKLPLLRKSHRL